LTVANQTVDQLLAPRTLTNVTLGIRAQSATIGCVTKGSVFVGTLPTTGTVTTPAGGLQFIVSPTTGQSVATQFAEAQFIVTVIGDSIQGNQPDQTFKITLDQDTQFFPQVANGCGGVKLGGGLSGGHLTDPGALCEDFDTDRNGNGSFQWTRLYPAADPNDPLRGIPDPNDDVIGNSVDGGPVPFGVSGQMCSTDTGFAAARATCHVVPSENDWHLHSKQEGCDPTYEPSPSFASSCAPEERAHSGFRSLHMGRHLNATDTLFDTYRMRQTSAFIMDPVSLGVASQLDFWHIIDVCDDRCNNAGSGNTFAGGQIQISLLNGGTGKFEQWQRLSPTQNGYNSLGQNIVVICEFDPGRPEPAEERDHLRDPAAVVGYGQHLRHGQNLHHGHGQQRPHQQGLRVDDQQDRRLDVQLDQRPELRLVPGERDQGQGRVGQRAVQPVVLRGTPGQAALAR